MCNATAGTGSDICSGTGSSDTRTYPRTRCCSSGPARRPAGAGCGTQGPLDTRAVRRPAGLEGR